MGISLVTKYQPLLDETLFSGLKSAKLFSKEVLFEGANAVKIYKVSDVVIDTYNRSAGYNASTFNGAWETFTLSQDYDAVANIDAMDNEETLDLSVPAFIKESENGISRKLDAYVFSKIAGTTNVPTANANLTANTILSAIETAESSLGNADVKEEGRILYISFEAYNLLKGACANRFALCNGEDVDRDFEMFDGMEIVRVPDGRFATGFEANSSASNGYQFNATTTKKINFIMLHESAIVGAVKHKDMKVIEPALNPDADAYKVALRCYGDAFVQDNKLNAIYVHTKA